MRSALPVNHTATGHDRVHRGHLKQGIPYPQNFKLEVFSGEDDPKQEFGTALLTKKDHTIN